MKHYIPFGENSVTCGVLDPKLLPNPPKQSIKSVIRNIITYLYQFNKEDLNPLLPKKYGLFACNLLTQIMNSFFFC